MNIQTWNPFKYNITWKVPFLDTVFSNTNFDDILSFENHNLKIERKNDIIEISYKLTYSTNVFIYEDNDHYWMTLNPDNFDDYNFDKEKIIRYRDIYDKLILTKDGYQFIGNTNTLYTVPLNSIEGTNIINDWVNRYKELIQSIPEDQLIIEFSGGICSKILTYFWCNTNKNYIVYITKDSQDIKQSTDIINYINENFPVNLTIINSLNDEYLENKDIFFNNKPLIKLCGINCFNDFNKINTKIIYNFLCDEINNQLSKKNLYTYINKNICPLLDKEILKLKNKDLKDIKKLLFDLLYNKDIKN